LDTVPARILADTVGAGALRLVAQHSEPDVIRPRTGKDGPPVLAVLLRAVQHPEVVDNQSSHEDSLGNAGPQRSRRGGTTSRVPRVVEGRRRPTARGRALKGAGRACPQPT